MILLAVVNRIKYLALRVQTKWKKHNASTGHDVVGKGHKLNNSHTTILGLLETRSQRNQSPNNENTKPF